MPKIPSHDNIIATMCVPGASHWMKSALGATLVLTHNAPTSLMGTTTWYLHGDNNALVFEKELKANGVTENRHYLQAAGMTFALVTTRSGAGVSSTASDLSKRSAQVRYFHQDHLNSIAVITDEVGQVVERLAYDPWGKRRNANGLADKNDSLVGQTTDRGYTEHEHLDEVGLIHMNGRVYDPLIGRFMSADPFIQSPGNLQSYNRYAYVMNNPLAYTDPSGYFSLKKFFRAAVAIAVAVYAPQYIYSAWAGSAAAGAAAAGTTLTTAQVTGMWIGSNAAAGALAGGISSDSSKGAAIGALSGGLFSAAAMTGGVGAEGANSLTRYAAHAGGGCVSSAAGGGSCGQGAASAVFGKYTTNAISGWGGDGTGAVIARGVATAVAGGVGSTIAGGKFANGAETAAYGYLFNQVQSSLRATAAGNAAAAAGGQVDPETGNRRLARAGLALDRLIDKSVGYGGPEEYQYRLVATTDGVYSDVRGGEVSLKAGETWKIGSSLDPDSRYSLKELRNWGVQMEVEVSGNKYEVLAVEKMKLMQYFVENWQLPPGNKMFK